jgi:hypothetical protein
MNYILDHPRLVFAVSFLAIWLSEWIGALLRERRASPEESTREDLNLIAAATLTLLGLIIGFTFSMAISRYDQRKTYEEAEANAIGTEFVRAGLLPATDAARVRTLLRDYLDQRILFYVTRDNGRLRQIDAATAQLETDLWSAVEAPAVAQPSPVVALAVSGMNDVLNARGYTQAAWWNRIPSSGWILMATIAICSNLLVGYCVRATKARAALLLVLPVVVSLSFFLISDIDSPRGGVIRVVPQNLESLSPSLRMP